VLLLLSQPVCDSGTATVVSGDSESNSGVSMRCISTLRCAHSICDVEKFIEQINSNATMSIQLP
jgi:hypothetical protein